MKISYISLLLSQAAAIPYKQYNPCDISLHTDVVSTVTGTVNEMTKLSESYA